MAGRNALSRAVTPGDERYRGRWERSDENEAGRQMNVLKSMMFAGAAGLAFATFADAADLPTKKGAPVPPAAGPSACASLQDFFLTDCQLKYYGIRLYGTVDIGYGFETFGAPWNPKYLVGVDYFLNKSGRPNLWTISPNGLSQSNVGVEIKEDFAPGWSLVGRAETGFDPYSLQLANGPGALRENNNLPLAAQSASGDSSRAGQAFNSQIFGGVSNTTFGTLTYGRQNTLLLDGVNAYDPMGGSYAFSVIGFSGVTAGTGDTEDARSDLAFKYRVSYNNLRAAAMVQTGGYEQGSAATGLYQFELGGDFNGFSGDAIFSHVENAVSASTFNGPVTALGGLPLPPSDTLKATISNNTSVMLLGKYKWNQLTVFGGYEDVHFSDPDSHFAVAGPLFTGIDGGPMQNQGDQFLSTRVLQIFWTGAKYYITPELSIAGAYYHYDQNNYNVTAVKVCSNSSSKGCSGTLDSASGLIDWQFAKKFDTYAGVLWTQVNNGLVNGYQTGGHVNVAPTVGLRFRF
jgi:predicted porin